MKSQKNNSKHSYFLKILFKILEYHKKEFFNK